MQKAFDEKRNEATFGVNMTTANKNFLTIFSALTFYISIPATEHIFHFVMVQLDQNVIRSVGFEIDHVTFRQDIVAKVWVRAELEAYIKSHS